MDGNLGVIGLGRTVPELDIGDTKPFEKTLFSMCTPEVLSHIKEQVKGKNQNLPNRFLIFSIPNQIVTQQLSAESKPMRVSYKQRLIFCPKVSLSTWSSMLYLLVH